MNRQITLAARPKGFPKDTDFKLVEAPLPEASAGEFLVQAIYLSVDPYMRGRMNDAKSYAEPVGIGDVMVGESVGRVIQSKNDRFPEGHVCSGDVWVAGVCRQRWADDSETKSQCRADFDRSARTWHARNDSLFRVVRCLSSAGR